MSHKVVKTLYSQIYSLEVLEVGKEVIGFSKTNIVIDNDLENYMVVSVPPSMSAASLDGLQKALIDIVGDKRVLIITHNIQFLKTKKISLEEYNKIMVN